ncbi:OprO/OprP family phosphate-selective porin [Commensalibacter sp. ESL0382]|uniref:OprO/OprP family phosphate-selective porin n=1 Tax=unclassified Commensalibacter TaxID=2630218 RepID=UPI0012D9B35E|nr:porin [Commensalibacter sp. ESL0382]MCT6842514.1 porin [Commensalibacter sp.]MUG34224.1 hypothetical protein [Commensalibacter sp. ESL0382]
MVQKNRINSVEALYRNIRPILSCSFNIIVLKATISFAYAQTERVSNSLISAFPNSRNKQSIYLCLDHKQDCTMWNADKIRNIDIYRDISYQIGHFNLNFPKGRPTLVSSDRRFSISLGASLQFDIGGIIGPDNKRNGSRMDGSQAFLRRGRFNVAIRYDDFIINITPDAGRPALVNNSIYEAYLKYVGFENTIIAIGLLQPPITMLDTESSNGFILVERPMIVDLVRNLTGSDARLALMMTHWNKRYYLSASVTGQRLGGTYQDFQRNELGGIVRAAVRPLAINHYDMHLGLSTTFVTHGDSRKYSLSTGQEGQVWLGRPYLRTGTIQGVNNIWAIGPEFAVRLNRFLIQSEYYSMFLQRVAEKSGNRPNLHFSGCYISVNYVLFGQPRSYDESKAVFTPPVGSFFNPVAGEWGALEWSIRWSNMNLNHYKYRMNENGHYLGVQGGKQNIFATGLNWYPSSHMRISLDYNHVMATRSRNNYYNSTGRTSNLIMSRVQFTF